MSRYKRTAFAWESIRAAFHGSTCGDSGPPARACMRSNKIQAPSNTSATRSISGSTARLGGLWFPALGLLVDDDGSECTCLGRGRRDGVLGGGGARVGLFLAAWLIVSMTDDWRETPELGVLGGAGATSVRRDAVGEAPLESTWSNDWAHETA